MPFYWENWVRAVNMQVRESLEPSILDRWAATLQFLTKYPAAQNALHLAFEALAYPFRVDPALIDGGKRETLADIIRSVVVTGETPEAWEEAGTALALASWLETDPSLDAILLKEGRYIVAFQEWESRRGDWYIQRRK